MLHHQCLLVRLWMKESKISQLNQKAAGGAETAVSMGKQSSWNHKDRIGDKVMSQPTIQHFLVHKQENILTPES